MCVLSGQGLMSRKTLDGVTETLLYNLEQSLSVSVLSLPQRPNASGKTGYGEEPQPSLELCCLDFVP